MNGKRTDLVSVDFIDESLRDTVLLYSKLSIFESVLSKIFR